MEQADQRRNTDDLATTDALTDRVKPNPLDPLGFIDSPVSSVPFETNNGFSVSVNVASRRDSVILVGIDVNLRAARTPSDQW